MNILTYGDGNAYPSTAAPSAATGDLVQLEDTRDPIDTEEWTGEMSQDTFPEVPVAAPMNVTTASDIYRTEDGICRYIDENGVVCGNKAGARHWMETHVMEELKGIDQGRLYMAQAPTLRTEAKVEAARRYRVFCPIPGCVSTRCHRFFVRKDSIVRHMFGCSDGYISKEQAKVWAGENMELGTQSPRFTTQWRDCWEAAIRKIYLAS